MMNNKTNPNEGKVILGPEVWQRVFNGQFYKHTRTLLKQVFKRDFGFNDWDAMGITIAEYDRIRGSSELPVWLPFCKLILETSEGHQRCNKCLEQIVSRMKSNHQIDISTCHAGLSDICAPLIYRDKYCGYYTMVGGVISHDPNEAEWGAIAERVKDTGVNLEALKKAYFEITPISEEFLKIMLPLMGVIVEEVIKAAVEVEEDKKRISELESALAEKYNFDKIIGKSRAMQEIFSLLRRIIQTDSPVLIEGETGTGKELIASTIHYNGPRKDKSFMAINCGGMTETLLESELFGHIKGSFTGAIRDKKGLFEVTDKGTLFLDEIGDMSPALQVKLLRVLQEGIFLPVGATEPRKADCRIISATNKNLKELVNQGKIREDLYYRINVIKVTLPPLRDRKDDIPLLINHFLKTSPAATEKKIQGIRPEAMKILLNYPWPGNIRELQNVLGRAISLTSAKYITIDDLPEEVIKKMDQIPQVSLTKSLEDGTKEFQKKYLSQLLSETQGDIDKAYRLVGTSRATFYNLLKKYHLKPGDFRLSRS
jgi:DNA-binding NtrC family response regulator